MNEIFYYSDDDYAGEGISLGIARGILVKYNNLKIVGEGTGIGSLALKNKLLTFFPTTCKTVQLSKTQFRKTFLIDSVMLWQLNDRPSRLLTALIELMANGYMFFPGFQNRLLKTGTFLRRLFKITPLIKKIPPVAEASFKYSIDSDEISVECDISSLQGYFSKAYILNELDADYFQYGIVNGENVAAPSGWNLIDSVSQHNAFYCRDYFLSFLIKKIEFKNNVPYKIFWGREKSKDLSWAGFELESDCRNKKIKKISCSYIVKLTDKGEQIES